MHGHIDPLFQLALTYWPLFCFALTHWLTPLWIIHNQQQSLTKQTLFWQHSKSYCILKFFVKKCVKISILPVKLANSFSTLTTLFLVFSLNKLFFQEKNLLRKDPPSFELLSKHPRHFQSWMMPPPPPW